MSARNRRHKKRGIAEVRLPTWSYFEEHVAGLLRSLGYQVDRDHLTAGSQIDLIAKKTDSLLTHRLIVECKTSKRPIGVEDLRRLALVVQTVNRSADRHEGMLVSSNGFTKTAKQFANESGLIAITVGELSAKTFDPTPIADGIVSWFERDELASRYVQLSCRSTEHHGGTIYKPVEKFLDEYLSATRRPGAVVLGNFGTGKTSLCKHYAYLHALRWTKGGGANLFPLYFALRDLDDFANLEERLFELLKNAYGYLGTFAGWERWLENNDHLIFLDGFDEMASRLDRVSINDSLAHLERFLEKFEVKVILTCRTHFFRTRVHERIPKGMLRLYLCDWGPAELREYVSLSLPKSAKQSLRTIQSTYNLEELSKTPIFLNMITETIEDLGGSVNQAQLYQVYTERWIEDQDYRSQLLPEEKRSLMKDLAWEMFRSGRARIHYRSLPIHLRDLMNLRDRESVSALDRDLRTCTFLVRDDDGNYHFVHKSFMEFFVALRLAEQVKQGNLKALEHDELTLEVAGFFGNYFESDWTVLFRHLMGSPVSACRANCAVALGTLNYSEALHEALVVAMRTEEDGSVRKRIVDSLLNLGRPEVLRAVLPVAEEMSDIGLHALRAVSIFGERDEILDLYASVLDIGASGQQCVVLEVVERDQLMGLFDSVKTLACQAGSPHEGAVPLALLGAIGSLAVGLERALAFQPFFDRQPFDVYEIERRDAVLARIRDRFVLEIEATAEQNKRSRLGRERNLKALRASYGYLIDDRRIARTLGQLYPPRKGRTLRRGK